MDAYIFATQATQEAVASLRDGVTAGGPARVVLPLIGSHALYVAVADDDDGGLNRRVADVVATPGLAGTSAYFATGPGNGVKFPTWGLVGHYVGFCLLDTLPGLAVATYQAVQQVAGVVGACVVTGAGSSVLVEATADDAEALTVMLHQVAGLPGVQHAATATGATALGAGFNG